MTPGPRIKSIARWLLIGMALNIAVAAVVLTLASRRQPPWEEVGPVMRATYPGVTREIRWAPGGSADCVEAVTWSGWPLRSLVKRSRYPQAGRSQTPGMIEIRPRYMAAEEIWFDAWKHRPAMLGFVGNSALFGLGLMSSWGLWRSARATIRRRRGRCPQCAYPAMEGVALCPECGAAVRSASPAAEGDAAGDDGSTREAGCRDA